MNYKVGDKVKLKESKKHIMSYRVLMDVERFAPNGIFTIKKISDTNTNGDLRTTYHLEEFEWAFLESFLEFAEEYKEPVPIKNRWELLDL